MQVPGATPTAITPARRTSKRMDAGATSTTTVMCGIPMNRVTGLRTATETGCTSLTTDGPGSDMSLGVGRPITMAAGCGRVVHGDGGLARPMGTVRSGRLHMFLSGDGVADLDLVSALAVGAASAGFRLDRVTGSIRGGVGTVAALAS